MSEPYITYHYRGLVERPAVRHGKVTYVLRHGFSENGEAGDPLYPWMTQAECKSDAKRRGKRARFEKNT